MPIQIADLMRDERTCTVSYQGESAQVTYRPGAYTPAVEDAFQTALETNRPSRGVAEMLAGVLVSWEVVDEAGQELAVEVEFLIKVSSSFLFAVIGAITADLNAEKEDRKNSAGGSRRAASKGRARRGSLS